VPVCPLLFIVLTRVNYNQFFYEILIKIILTLIKIIAIDNRYFALSYCNKLLLSVIVSLTQLVRTMHNICKVWGSNPIHHKKAIIIFFNDTKDITNITSFKKL